MKNDIDESLLGINNTLKSLFPEVYKDAPVHMTWYYHNKVNCYALFQGMSKQTFGLNLTIPIGGRLIISPNWFSIETMQDWTPTHNVGSTLEEIKNLLYLEFCEKGYRKGIKTSNRFSIEATLTGESVLRDNNFYVIGDEIVEIPLIITNTLVTSAITIIS